MTSAEKIEAQRVFHPAQKAYIISAVLLLLTVLFGFISVFVPWAMKDLAVGQRAWAYPFQTCIQQTFSKVNEETCMDNDFIVPEGVPLTGGSAKCKGFILATIAMVFISVLLGVVTLLLLIYIILNLWSRPSALGMLAQVFLFIIAVAAMLAWVFFLVYATTTCAPNSIFPVHGYSYGFILYIFASTFSIGALVAGFLGLSTVRKFVAEERTLEDQIPLQPVEPEVPQSYPTYPVDAGYEQGGIPPNTPYY